LFLLARPLLWLSVLQDVLLSAATTTTTTAQELLQTSRKNIYKTFANVFRPPGTVVPGRPYVVLQFLFFQREISEVPWPIAAKLCVMLKSMFNFITPVQKFGACAQKILGTKTP